MQNWQDSFKGISQSGDYKNIAETLELSEGTVKAFFSKRGNDTVSKKTADGIKNACLLIARERILNGMEWLRSEKFPLRPRKKSLR